MAIINMHDAKTQLSDLVARAEAGEEIVIARRNKPAVRLVRVDASDDMAARVGFGESEQAPFDLTGLPEAVEKGREFTIMRGGKEVAKVVPVKKGVRGFGSMAHLRSNLPPDLFDEPLPEDELDAWEGKYSNDPEP